MMMKTGRREKMKALKVAALFTVCRMIEDRLVSAFSDGYGRHGDTRHDADAQAPFHHPSPIIIFIPPHFPRETLYVTLKAGSAAELSSRGHD